MGTLELKWGPNGDPKTEKGPHGDRVPQMGTHVGTVVIPASQFEQFSFNLSGGTGVKTRGAGEGMPFMQGEKGAGEFSR